MNMAMAKLRAAQARTGSLISAGLEPAPEYLPKGFQTTPAGYEAFLRMVINATSGLVCAYKINLAFFESMGSDGSRLLERTRAMIPNDVLLIADAKRGDIGSTAKHYARALYDILDADSATVNPLMGRDSAEPFLAYDDKLTFFLVLTSNPGAADFLLSGQLYQSIAQTIATQWNARSNCGFVVGATKPEHLGPLRTNAPGIPFLIPGVGAQGGDIDEIGAQATVAPDDPAYPGLIFHVTRGLLPSQDDEMSDPAEAIRNRATHYRAVSRRVLKAAHVE